MATPNALWILKTEPETYSFEDLKHDQKTPWNGVRNYQARNFLKQAKKGDAVLIYHSGEERALRGFGRVSKEAFPDLDPKRKGDWVQIEVSYDKPLKNPIGLNALKANPRLRELLLLKQSRLSVIPVPRDLQNDLFEMFK